MASQLTVPESTLPPFAFPLACVSLQENEPVGSSHTEGEQRVKSQQQSGKGKSRDTDEFGAAAVTGDEGRGPGSLRNSEQKQWQGPAVKRRSMMSALTSWEHWDLKRRRRRQRKGGECWSQNEQHLFYKVLSCVEFSTVPYSPCSGLVYCMRIGGHVPALPRTCSSKPCPDREEGSLRQYNAILCAFLNTGLFCTVSAISYCIALQLCLELHHQLVLSGPFCCANPSLHFHTLIGASLLYPL